MIETRTLRLYDHARRRMSVFRQVAKYRCFWTARTASTQCRTSRIYRRNPKTLLSSITYERCTAWTAISGFSMMRVCTLMVTLELAKLFLPSSRHIKPGNCCPSCPSIDFIEEYRLLAALLHVRSISISALAVQNRLRSIAFFVNVAFPTRLESEKWGGWERIPSIRLTVLGVCSKPTPPGLGTVPVSFPVRAGTTPENRQSNRSKNWVVRVVRLTIRLTPAVNANALVAAACGVCFRAVRAFRRDLKNGIAVPISGGVFHG